MQGKSMTMKVLIVMILAALLGGCAISKPTPTPDPQAVFTQAAQTVQVAMTQTAAAKPSSTMTATTAPTNTPAPTQAQPTQAPVTAVPVNPATATKSPDVGVWVSQNPGDGVSLNPGQQFTLTWQVKNTGTTTWTTAYMLRYYLNDPALRMGAPDQHLSKEVKPGEIIDLTLNLTAPTAQGNHGVIWVLTNKDGANFSALNFNFTVGQPLTPTATSEVVPTATVSNASPTPTP
ncbi:MAG TPA: NBR1-Ig-like domain-containing protein [Bellilinea sp.]|nr:NBR1-Ig-like domain-containing protein [Bellilinea sp.]